MRFFTTNAVMMYSSSGSRSTARKPRNAEWERLLLERIALTFAVRVVLTVWLAVSTEGAKAAERWVTHHVEGRNSTK